MLNLTGIESKFKKLKVGKDSAKSIMKTYCKASDAQMSGDDLNMTYSGKDYSESVYLTFKKQYDGTLYLVTCFRKLPYRCCTN